MQFAALLVKVIGNPCSRLVSDAFDAVSLLLGRRVTNLLEAARVCANDTCGIELICYSNWLRKRRLERCYLQAGEEPDKISQIAIIRGVKRSYISFSLTAVDNKGRILSG